MGPKKPYIPPQSPYLCEGWFLLCLDSKSSFHKGMESHAWEALKLQNKFLVFDGHKLKFWARAKPIAKQRWLTKAESGLSQAKSSWTTLSQAVCVQQSNYLKKNPWNTIFNNK